MLRLGKHFGGWAGKMFTGLFRCVITIWSLYVVSHFVLCYFGWMLDCFYLRVNVSI